MLTRFIGTGKGFTVRVGSQIPVVEQRHGGSG